MSLPYEELDYRNTPTGALVLRRRRTSGAEIFEVKLGDAFLMSSQFTAGEIALANLGLAACDHPAPDVIVGGLGLGYTAMAVLEHVPGVRSLRVIEKFGEVIDWHHRHLVPLGVALTRDDRCQFLHADFFALLRGAQPCFDSDNPDRKVHAVLLDIDHSPCGLLDPAHGAFYTVDGLGILAKQLHCGGVFALWSNEPPEPAFLSAMESVFQSASAHVVEFWNASQERKASNTIYVGRTAG